ncbi:MAG: cyclic peptide export ABC transporter [Vicinamibacterales bacterium]
MFQFLTTQPLARLLRRGSQRFDLEMASFVAFSGLANAGLLAIINAAAENASNQAANDRLLALFAITIGLYVFAQRFILITSITEVERILGGIRVRVADDVRKADLESLEHLGRSEIFGVVARETQNISQAASTLVMATQALMMVTFSVGYLAILSKTAFIITVAVCGVGILLHLQRAQALTRMLGQAQRKENEFLALLTHLLDGFKEVRLRKARGADLFQHLRAVSGAVEAVKVESGREFSSHFLFSQLLVYGLLAAIVFLLPRVSPEYSGVVLKLTAAVLFIIGPLGSIVNAVPIFSAANVAAQNIFDIEAQLTASSVANQNGRPEAPPPAPFSRIHMQRTVFQYPDRGTGSVFRLGPIDLDVNAGEMLFIVGGNGSGKSTLLKALTGLYHPQSGTLTMDDTLVSADTATWYRSHFAAVFSEYHLFDRLYGLGDVPAERVSELLALMQISHKTAYENGRFTTLDLSHGQRKRLALLVALLEDRPILVLDEWAADQDPPFRQFFYETLLPRLKRDGKTVIAVSHDDKYFHVADRVVKMEYGEFVPYKQA